MITFSAKTPVLSHWVNHTGIGQTEKGWEKSWERRVEWQETLQAGEGWVNSSTWQLFMMGFSLLQERVVGGKLSQPLKWSFLVLLRVVWPFLPLLSPVPGNSSPLTSYAVWPTISGCWDLCNPPPSEHLEPFQKSCWKWTGTILCPKADASVATTTLQGVGHAASIVPIPNFQSQTGTDGALAKNAGRWATDLPHWRGGCHPAQGPTCLTQAMPGSALC